MIKDVTKLPRRSGETLTDAIVRCYHEAFLVETIGAAAAGIPLSEFEALKEAGLVKPSVRYTDRPDLPDNEFLIVAVAAGERVRATPEKQTEMLDWTPKQWANQIKISVPGTSAPVVENEALTQTEQLAFSRVTRDTADYCRGLGNIIASEFRDAEGEVWRGEKVLDVPDPIRRVERIGVIREVLQTAIKERRSAQKAAGQMAKATGDYVRDWKRIAETELQALYNDATVLAAIANYGPNVKIARVPETNACRHCLRLFLDPDTQKPRLFTPRELVANGTNIGKPRAQWKPTVYPIHPRCRCGTQAVPPGWSINRYGGLTPPVRA